MNKNIDKDSLNEVIATSKKILILFNFDSNRCIYTFKNYKRASYITHHFNYIKNINSTIYWNNSRMAFKSFC